MFRFSLCLSLILGLACSKSSTIDDDAGIEFDASRSDTGVIERDGGGGVDGGTDPACGDNSVDPGEECDDGNTRDGDGCDSECNVEAECGDSRLDPGEGCDDGNTEDGDGCDSTCRREAFCGDGNMDPDEVCDDGNNRSGDGCRSDCASDETCGNGVRDAHVGEACDSTAGCNDSCQITMCGNGDIDSGETCDDGGTEAFDGCGVDCQEEISFIISRLLIGGEDVGCDFSGDGVSDNRFAEGLGGLVDLANSMFLEDAIANGQLTLLLQALALDDRAGANEESFSLAFMQGQDADDDPGNNLTGMGEFFVDGAALDVDGRPLAAFESSIMSRILDGGPEDIEIPILILPLEIRQARIQGRTRAMRGEISEIDEGLICGAVPLVTMAFLPNLLDMFGMSSPPCDDSMIDSTLADLLVGGTPRGFIFPLPGIAPDVDLDGDGLERFEVDRRGSTFGCQPVITACVDGDGTRVEGRDCIMDARFEDGWSAAFPMEAVRAEILGVR
ncbi:MAG: DUF4215 domain-containing protein [Myxococcota bacterium]